MEPRRWSGRVPAWQPATGHHASKLVLTCHERLPLSSPAWRRAWRFLAKSFSGSGFAGAAIAVRCSGSVGTVIGDSAIAAPPAAAQARLQQRRRANCRHQRSPEGRLDHRDRQREYRRRQPPVRARVTDQGSLSIAFSGTMRGGISRSLARGPPAFAPQPRVRIQGSRFWAASSAAAVAVWSTLSRAFHDPREEE